MKIKPSLPNLNIRDNLDYLDPRQLAYLAEREQLRRFNTFWQDFRAFAFQGNVVDLAVGIIIGGSFNKIVQSLVSDIIMPIFGRILGNAAFTDLYINLGTKDYPNLAEAVKDGAPVIKYGAFLTNIVDFMIVALTLFIILRYVLHQKKKEEIKQDIKDAVEDGKK